MAKLIGWTVTIPRGIDDPRRLYTLYYDKDAVDPTTGEAIDSDGHSYLFTALIN